MEAQLYLEWYCIYLVWGLAIIEFLILLDKINMEPRALILTASVTIGHHRLLS